MTDGTGVMTDDTSVINAGPVRGRAVRAAVRAGINAGWIELSHCFTMLEDSFEILFFTLVSVVVLVVANAKHTHVPGTHFLIGSTLLAGLLGASVGLYGIALLGMNLTVEREDGTLLRAKATPNGILGYLIAKVVLISGTILCIVASEVIVGLALFSGLALGSAANWLTLTWVLALGLLATLPLGVVLGSLFPSTRSAIVIAMGTGLLGSFSGIFYPITHLPVVLQWVGQAFPLYWLGLGIRSALLPGNLAAVEIGHSWRHLATAGVLGAWAVAGLVLAPVLLRRVARREAGSKVAARRERAMTRARIL
jgi:ABC-2 type transport system permease protein